MHRHHLGLRAAMALGVTLALCAGASAQVHQSTVPYCPPYGYSYMHPIYPYGNYAGFPNTAGGVFAHYGTNPYPNNPWPSYPLKFREDAYAPGEMYPWGLHPDPALSKPKAQPYVPPNPKKSPAPPKPAPDDISTDAGLTAKVVVQVPVADAMVRVQGVTMKTMGLARNFVTPELIGEGPFHYKIEATWTVAGEERSQTRWVEVQPGNSKTVTFGP